MRYEVGLGPGADLLLKGQDVGGVRERLLPVGGADLGPPHVDVVALDLLPLGAPGSLQEDAKVLIHRVLRIGGVPQAEEVARSCHRSPA